MRLPEPGEIVGPYTCGRLLASGGMGAVFEAEHRQLGRQVALKVLLAPDDPELVARFEREAEACARLQHPNLVVVHDSGTSGRVCYMALELVRGESLGDKLTREGPFSEERAIAAVEAAAKGIAHAHAVGVLHRDLKPGNLLWDEELGEVRVVDFGLTGRLRQADSLTVTGEVLGTPGYLAPEQASGDTRSAGQATDVYGLGATLFALLTGRPPFVAPGLAGLAAVALEPPPDLRQLRPEVSPGVAAAVAKSLAKEPAERWASVTAFAEALRQGEEPRRAPRLVLTALIALALLLGGGALLHAGRARPPRALVEYSAWRAERFDAFLWEDDLAGARLQEWSQALGAAPATEARDQALAEIAALSRLREQRSQGKFAEGPGPGKPSSREALVSAVSELEAWRFDLAAQTLERVEGAQRATQTFGLCSRLVEVGPNPGAFAEELSGEPRARAWAMRAFPAALTAVAKAESAEVLLDLYRHGAEAGVPLAEQALRAALEASVSRRLGELRQARGREADYLRQVCKPLRQAGLWPGEAFQRSCRAEFTQRLAESEDCPPEEVMELIRYEHELFYRVQPARSTDSRFTVKIGLRLDSTRLGPEDSRIVGRTKIRYNAVSSERRTKPGVIPRWVEVALRSPEPGSRLDAAAEWWRSGRDPRDLGATQSALAAVLEEGVPDLDVNLTADMIREVWFRWRDLSEASEDQLREWIPVAERIGWREFERALEWQLLYPLSSLTDPIVDSVRLAAAGHLYGKRFEAGYALYGRALARLHREAAEVDEDLRLVLERSLRTLYARLGNACPLGGEDLMVEILEPGIPLMKRKRARRHVRDSFWSPLLVGLVGRGRVEEAARAADHFGEAKGFSWRLLHAIARVRLAEGRLEEAQKLAQGAQSTPRLGDEAKRTLRNLQQELEAARAQGD